LTAWTPSLTLQCWPIACGHSPRSIVKNALEEAHAPNLRYACNADFVVIYQRMGSTVTARTSWRRLSLGYPCCRSWPLAGRTPPIRDRPILATLSTGSLRHASPLVLAARAAALHRPLPPPYLLLR